VPVDPWAMPEPFAAAADVHLHHGDRFRVLLSGANS
jgi:hypothetical protein